MAYLSDQLIIARRIEEDFVPDGNLAKTPWLQIPGGLFETSYEPSVRYPESSTEIRAAWTRQWVYFAFSCAYTELNVYPDEDASREKWELWNRDVVEVFANPFPERLHTYWEFEVAPNNLWIDLEIDVRRKPIEDAAWDSGFEHATLIEPATRIWTCEMRIPVKAFGLEALSSGSEWRINFFRCDGPGDDTQRRFLAWSPTYDPNFHVPQRFGRIRFEGPGPR